MIGLWLTPDQQGRYYFGKSDYKAAAESFQSPLWKGIAYYRSKNFEAAVEQFARVDTPEGYFNLGDTYAHLGLLEQAAFIDELKNVRGMTVAEIATELSRSKAWVSMRLGLIAEMSPRVRDKLLGGEFPVYPYMYVVRQFMRMNGVKSEQIEEFVLALSGRPLSVREIEQLAHAFFRGPDSFRQQILSGNIALPLKHLKEVPADPEGCSEFERLMLRDLELAQQYMQRVMAKSQDERLASRNFHAQCHLLTNGILSRSTAFFQTLRKLHDRSGQA